MSRRLITHTIDHRSRRAPGGRTRRAAFADYKGVFDALPSHIAVLDQRGSVIRVNTAWQRFARENGLAAANYGVGMNYLALCDRAAGTGAEEAPRVAAGLRRLLQKRTGEFRCEYPCHSPGKQRWFQLRATCLEEPSGLYLVLAHQNITELKQRQERLHQAQGQLQTRLEESTAAREQTSTELQGAICQTEAASSRLAAIVESSQDAIISKDLQGIIRSWNASAEKLFGYSAQEAIGQPVTLIIPEDKRLEAATLLEGFREGQRIEHLETVCLAKDGRRIEVSLTVSPVRDASGAVSGASKIIRDITKRKRAEEALAQIHAELESRVRERTAELAKANEALRNSERRLAILAAATFEGIGITQDGCFVDANEQLARMLGYPREELLGKRVEELIPPEDLPRVMPNLLAGRESHVEHEMSRKDGTRLFVEAHGQTVEVEGQPVRFTALRDITERRRMEQALARYTRELDQRVADRTAELHETVEELKHFSYALLHDLRAPLRAMMSFASLIEMKCAMACQEPEVMDYLNRIKASSERLDHLVRDALNYARVLRRDFPLRPVALLPLLHGMLESYPELWPHQSEIHLAPTLSVVLGNEAVLTEVFSNLLRNAIKFVAPGVLPRVRLWAERVAPEEAGGPAIAGPGAAPPGTGPAECRVRIWVEDNGIGIPREAQDSIFTMFRQLHGSELYPGTGIGLAIVRKAVERVGGRVGVESKLGQGSRFWVELRESTAQPALEAA